MLTREQKRNIYNNIQNLYNMDFKSWQEVLSMLYNLVADVDQKFDVFEQKFILLLGDEVTKSIKELYENGMLAEIINLKVFGDINNRIEDLNRNVNNHALNKANEIDLQILKNRMNSFTALPNQNITSVGDAELLDGKIGFLSEKYGNIGESIREQIKFIVNNGLLPHRIVNLSNASAGYVSSSGNLYSDSAFKSSVMPLKKGETVLVYGNGYRTNVSMVAQKLDNNTYKPLVVSLDGEYRWYEYTATADINIILSFLEKDKAKAIILKQIKTEINNKVNNELLGVQHDRIGVVNDCYIKNNGTKVEGTVSSHVMSYPIQLKKGDVLYVECTGVKDVVSIISRVNNNVYTPLVISNGGNSYRYEALEDIEIVISAHSSWNNQYSIYNKFNEIHTRLLNNSIDLQTRKISSYINDCYISADGRYINNTSSYHKLSEKISLNKGDVLYVECTGVANVVAIISRVNNNVYTPLVISNGSNSYRYEAKDNMEVVISAHNSWDGKYNIYNKTDYSLINDTVDFTPSFSMFETFGIIGDSYASGEVAIESYIDYYNVSWGQILARMCGNKCINFSSGGLSTRSWLTAPKGLQLLNSSPPQQLYIGALGINDWYKLGASYIGTTADITSKTDTFYGNYAKIIEAVKVKSPKAKIILLTTAGTNDTAIKVNNAIINLAKHYKIPYIVQNDDSFFNSKFYLNYMANGHPIAIVYSAMAKTFRRLIEQCMYDNINYFWNYTGQ